jgi:hypothetical protein
VFPSCNASLTPSLTREGGVCVVRAQVVPHEQLLLEGPGGDDMMSPPARHMEEMLAVVVRHRHGDNPPLRANSIPGMPRWMSGGGGGGRGDQVSESVRE